MLTETARLEAGNPLLAHSSSVGSLGDLTLSKVHLVLRSSPCPPIPLAVISSRPHELHREALTPLCVCVAGVPPAAAAASRRRWARPEEAGGEDGVVWEEHRQSIRVPTKAKRFKKCQKSEGGTRKGMGGEVCERSE